MLFFGMCFCVDLVWTDVLKERIASVFRVEKSASEEPAWAGGVGQFVIELKVYIKLINRSKTRDMKGEFALGIIP
jgi:hypothetical protein